MEAGKVELDAGHFRCAETIGEALRDACSFRSTKGVDLTVETDAGAGHGCT